MEHNFITVDDDTYHQIADDFFANQSKCVENVEDVMDAPRPKEICHSKAGPSQNGAPAVREKYKRQRPIVNLCGKKKVSGACEHKFMRKLSGQLAAYLGKTELTRSEVVHRIWFKIFKGDMLNKQDTVTTHYDDKMRELFGVDKFKCNEMGKYKDEHFKDPSKQ